MKTRETRLYGTYPQNWRVLLRLEPAAASALLGYPVDGFLNKKFIVLNDETHDTWVCLYCHDGQFMLIEVDAEKQRVYVNCRQCGKSFSCSQPPRLTCCRCWLQQVRAEEKAVEAAAPDLLEAVK